MRLHELKDHLTRTGSLRFYQPSGEAIPTHFHLTEIGEVTKVFIDCGGTLRRERRAALQLWIADDYDHRLEATKAVSIIELAERQLRLGNLEIEVEYQGAETIGKYGLAASGERLQLVSLRTDCLARAVCTPASGCC